jgi:hypothetical protein
MKRENIEEITMSLFYIQTTGHIVELLFEKARFGPFYKTMPTYFTTDGERFKRFRLWYGVIGEDDFFLDFFLRQRHGEGFYQMQEIEVL